VPTRVLQGLPKAAEMRTPVGKLAAGASLESRDTRPRMIDLSYRSYHWYRRGRMSEAHRESGFSLRKSGSLNIRQCFPSRDLRQGSPESVSDFPKRNPSLCPVECLSEGCLCA
jgi:hypothetical protein